MSPHHNFIVLLLVLAALSSCGQISSWDTRITYSYNGSPLSYNLFFKLDSGIGATDYLRLLWPEALHTGTDKTQILVTLISNENNYQITQVSCTASPVDSNGEYFMTFGSALTAGKWYQIQVYPNNVNTLTQGLIQMESVSDYGSGYISYDQNFAFGYYYIRSGATPATLGVAVSSTSSNKNKASQIYTINIDLTPSITSATGGNFTVFLEYDSTQASHLTSGTTLLDFAFAGICQSAIPASCPACPAAVLNYCSISSDLSTITFSTGTITASTKISITTQVQNPQYISVRGIRAYWVDFISGNVVENGQMISALTVNPITISSPGPSRVQLFWGIQKNYTDSYVSNIVFGLYMATTVGYVGPLNSFNNGFMISDTPPINAIFSVRMTLGAQGVLEGSIVHNLPAATGKSVFCAYATPYLTCKNVGAFININYRYFISGKAYFASSTTNPLSAFGDVSILSVVQDSNGNILSNVKLFTDMTTGENIAVTPSTEFLDTGGWQSTSNKVGYTRIVSYADDLTLSSTANAIYGFFNGGNATVGIVPDLGGSQQLLFLLNVPQANMDSGASSNLYTMQILYNSKVIGFESGTNGLGLDFVGYSTSLSAWSISYTSCYQDSAIMCQKYNNNGNQTMNSQISVNDSNGKSLYGLFTFNCGSLVNSTTYCSGGSCKSICQMFKGYSTSDTYGGVVSMRRVTFPSGYQSSLYADNNLLDFVVVFTHNNGLVSSTLINAYTIKAAKMANIKYAYANFYDDGWSYYNKGIRLPTMARIGGGVLPTESLGATVVAVFFDENMDATTFLTSSTSNYSIGCSTGQCLYYPNLNVPVPRDNWPCSDRVEFYNLPSIQNQFNLLVPITQKVGNPPRSLVIAFLSQNYTVNGVTGLLQVLSVYRLFGPTITGSVQGGPIGYMSSLSSGSCCLPDMNFVSSSFSMIGGFSYSLNTSNIMDNPPNNTFTIGSTNVNYWYPPNGSYWGSGITITSFNYNIFASATLKFSSPPANTAPTCSIFSYVYNEMVSGNAQRTGKYNYIAYCPIDSFLNISTSAANIVFNNPQYPNYFVSGFPIQTVLAYGYSDNYGFLRAYNLETSSISYTRSCSTVKLQQYYPNSPAQRASFTVTFPQILIAPTPNGYPSMRFQLTLPSTTVTSTAALTIRTPNCDVSSSYLTCSVFMSSTTSYTVTITLANTNSYILTTVTFSLYADSTASFGTANNYTVTMYLPQSTSGTLIVYGSDYTYQSSICAGSSLFTVAITQYSTVMNFNNLTYDSLGKSLRGKFGYNFGANSYREVFYTTSYFEFNFGFLSVPNTAWNAANNFRCVVYSNGTSTLSSLWKKLDLTTLTSAKLYSKSEISNPASMLFNLVCYGGGMSDNTNTNNMTLKWWDGAYTLQTATQIAPLTFTSMSAFSTSPTLSIKRFNSEGSLAFYEFSITSSAALDQNARIYFEFPYKIPASLNRQSALECYTRTTNIASTNDANAAYTYCQLIGERQLVVWNNGVVAAGITFYIDVFGVSQPKMGDVSATSIISISVDLDTDYSNGVSQYGSVNDQNINAAATNVISITSSMMSSNYIRSQQDITVGFTFAAAGKLTAGRNLYFVFPASYAIWIQRSSTISSTNCILTASGSLTNLGIACVYISQRVLKITVDADAGTSYTLTLKGIKSSPFMPIELQNNIRFFLYLTTASTELQISDYSYDDRSSSLSLIQNTNLIDLSWLSYSVTLNGSALVLSQSASSTVNVFIGYFTRIVEVRQSLYPSNFKSSITFTINNQPTGGQFVIQPTTTINIGYATQYLRIAASSTVATGLYNLQFTKTGDSGNYYTDFPPLTVIVQNTKCMLTTKEPSYTIPVGGYSLPIIIEAYNCIPMSGINITATFNSTEVTTVTDLTNTYIDSSSAQGRIYIALRHNGVLAAGASIIMTLTISGTNAASYGAIPTVPLTLIAPSVISIPSALALSNPTLTLNTATFNLQCSVASTIYWGLGIYPSILNTGALGFQARIVSGGQGLMSNFTELQDYYWQVYGVEYMSIANQIITKTVYGLKSNTNYLFKYFCINQNNQISDGQIIQFNSTDNGAYLMKVLMTFTGPITYGQFNDLACSLAKNFVIPYSRVYTEAISYCGQTNTIFYNSTSSFILDAANSNNQYIYNFYIIPDYSLQQDSTNLNIRQQLSQQTFSTQIITSTNNFIGLPTLVQMQTADVENLGAPIYTVSSVLAGLNGITLNVTITNMNGFVLVAVMDGTFMSNMSLPTITSLKQGLFQSNMPLLNVQFQYVPQNYNVSFTFSNLSQNTTYSLFHFATVDDPTLTALTTVVTAFNISTLTPTQIDINFQLRLTLLFMVVVLMLLFV